MLSQFHEPVEVSITASASSSGVGTAASAGALKAAPPLVVSGATLMGMPVADWVQYATLLYVTVLTARTLWQWLRDYRTGKSQSQNQGGRQ